MALYVASHYKNSPNDLQLMADAPAHHLFVLLGKTFFFELMLLLFLFIYFIFFAWD
jgi:tRNA(Met) C34 N-acetyltransferase TmcA